MAAIGGISCNCKCDGRRCYYDFRELIFENINSALRNKSREQLRNISTISLFRKGCPKLKCVLSKSRSNRVLSMDAREKSKSGLLKSSERKRIPVFVMMPFDSFGVDASGTLRINRTKTLSASLIALKSAGVHGIAVEVWWGIVERKSPIAYDWSLYEELFKLISESGLKLHIALSFHSNVHLTPRGKMGVNLPLWIQQIGVVNRDIFYQDQYGLSNYEYLTLGVDKLPLFSGRTALQCYEDFIFSFVNKFDSLMGYIIEEISVGLGPEGELRYPAHPCGDGRWRFPGIGEFQCYDKYMMEDLSTAAEQVGKPQWGVKGPQNAGCYNSFPFGTPFFEFGPESFRSDYGYFFLEWYSGKLIHHADVILAKAAHILKKYQEEEKASVLLVAKIGLIYWWYKTFSHPAELTAGYYNTAARDGYEPFASMLHRHGVALHISCLEMMDGETPQTYLCSPELLLQQLCSMSRRRDVRLTGRNHNERCDEVGLQRIQANCYHPQAESMRSFTYFRMGENLFSSENWRNFVSFVRSMNAEN